jgi:predicted metal-dependent peptidase
VLDTSGSMTADELAQGVAEVSGILKQVSRGRSTLHVIACDHAADDAQTVRSAAAVRLVGGGGTDMRIGMRAAAELRPRADFVVVFTDGETPWPDAPPAANPGARYIAVLSDGPRPGVPDWMRTIVVERGPA